jgi:uncharacterized membrane protein YoaK (UPF0700 family)
MLARVIASRAADSHPTQNMPPAAPNPDEESSFNATDIASAILLAATGGVTDAIVYLDHGHVFANAMTGNVIFLGIALMQKEWAQSLRHIVPIACFLLGVVGARLIRTSPVRRSALLVLVLEIAGFFIVGLLPVSFPQLAFTAIVAFVSAFQVATFRRVGRFTYNSTFVTGNLRMVAEGIFDRIFSPFEETRSKGYAQAWKLGLICSSFFLGALGGAYVAPRYPSHAILFAEPLLLVTAVLVLLSPTPAPEAAPRSR